ncbi:bifunctional enoyl-CoA hydratase/phosphate acetyltransferase [candidate division WOR-3 bacterium]|nr:bifunctional enoyl-CoA hydratase/phosphate acetyltransferase [candidate division WOR-3 bacterium]
MKSFEALIRLARARGSRRCVVVKAEDEAALEGIKLAQDLGLITPVLVGDKHGIAGIAKKVGLDTTPCEIHHEPEENQAIIKAIALVKEQGDFLMKGMLSTSAFLKGVMHRETGLRQETILSHIAALEIPGYHKLLFMSDGGMNPRLNLETRIEIIRNAIDTLRLLGIEQPKIALVAASEMINPDMPETVDAAKIAELNRTGRLAGAVIDGPFGFDVAVSKKAASTKKIDSTVAGDADFILMPNISAANIWAKGLMYFCRTRAAGMVAGALRPIIMLSRADDPQTKLNSIALGVVIAHR